MNYVYTITDRQDSSLFKRMVDSFCQHCKFKLLLNVFEENKEIQSYCESKLPNDLIIKPIDKSKWSNRRMAFKIENIMSCQFNDGDNVFILDDDLLIRDDIFKVFDWNFDVCITSRHYPYWYVVNGGVWGFKWNDRTKKFMDFYISQIHNPSWGPLVQFRKQFSRYDSLDWWVDQDFLCTIYRNKLPFACEIRDLGPNYNFCPSVEEGIPGTFEKAKAETLYASKNKNIKILHLKGRLKNIVGEIA